MASFLALLALAYLLGSLPTGVLVARLLGGPDPRRHGSGNVGAANMFRLLGPRAGVLTFLGDALKGWLPTFLALWRLVPLGIWQEWAVALVGLSAVMGHVLPLFLHFRGGKAVATAFGVIAAVCPPAAVLLLGIYLLAASLSRIFSVASLTCALVSPLAVGFLCPPRAYLALAGLLAFIILLRHRENLSRLRRGEEPRF